MIERAMIELIAIKRKVIDRGNIVALTVFHNPFTSNV